MAWSGYIKDISDKFNDGVYDLSGDVAQALEDLASNPSDPALLATYQSLLAEYTVFRTAQSSAVKAIKELDLSMIQKW